MSGSHTQPTDAPPATAVAADAPGPTDTQAASAGWRLSLAVAAGAFVALSLGLFWGIPDGKAINGGLRILEGELPYRDFWSMYAPGQFYLVAALFRTFGFHVLVQGFAAVLILAAAAGVLFRIFHYHLGLAAKPSVLATLLVVAMEWHPGREMSSYEPLLLCAFLVFTFVLRYFQGHGGTNLLWAGIAGGIGAWFKHDVAFYVMAGSTAAVLLGPIVSGRGTPGGWPAWRAIGVLAGSCAATVLPVVLFLAWTAGPDAWHDLIRFPATEFRIVRGEPYPALLPPRALRDWVQDVANPGAAYVALTQLAVWILAHMPQLVFAGTGAWLLARRRTLAPATLSAGLLFLSCMPFFWAAAHVQRNTHLASMAILSLLLGAIVWARLPSGLDGRRARRLLAAALCIYAVGMTLRPALAVARVVYQWPGSRTMAMPMVRGIRAPADAVNVYEPIVSFVRAHVPPDEPIYVGVERHDAIVISDQAFYYLAGRRSATRYNELHPGFADDPEYQQEMIDDLQRRQIRCIVLWRFGWDDRLLDQIRDARRARLPELGATRLDDFIRSEFDVLAEHGEFALLWRRGAPRAPASAAAAISE